MTLSNDSGSHVVTRHRVWVGTGSAEAVLIADLLAADAIERLWSHLPLTVFCDCEEEWDDDLQDYVRPDCDCDRKTILAVRNSLAAVLGESQVSA